MIQKIRLPFLSLIIFILSSCASTSPKSSDLDFIHKTIIENHPGIYNDYDPNFKSNLKREYIRAKQNLAKVVSSEEQKKIIEEFIRSL